MNIKRIDIGSGVLAAALLGNASGVAQAYAVPPTLDAEAAAVASAPFGMLLWLPLLVLMLLLVAGLVWSLRAQSSAKPARRESSPIVSPPARPARLARIAGADQPRHKPRRWRRIPAAAH